MDAAEMQALITRIEQLREKHAQLATEHEDLLRQMAELVATHEHLKADFAPFVRDSRPNRPR